MSTSYRNCRKNVGGLLLSGGASHRMGRDKGSLPSGPSGEGPPLAQRSADILRAVTRPALEVGPGFSDLALVHEPMPGSGPLVALAAGAAELLRDRSLDAAVVIATDLPMLRVAIVSWLAHHPGPGTVVPVVAGAPQTLCARYDRSALEASVEIAGHGARSMRELLSVLEPAFAGSSELRAAGIDPSWFGDVDTPGDLASYRAGDV